MLLKVRHISTPKTVIGAAVVVVAMVVETGSIPMMGLSKATVSQSPEPDPSQSPDPEPSKSSSSDLLSRNLWSVDQLAKSKDD